MSISDRIRAGIEAAPWVIEKVRKLEAEVERLKGKLMEEARWVYDTGQRAKDALAEVERLRSAISRFVAQYPRQDGPEIQELKALKEEG